MSVGFAVNLAARSRRICRCATVLKRRSIRILFLRMNCVPKVFIIQGPAERKKGSLVTSVIQMIYSGANSRQPASATRVCRSLWFVLPLKFTLDLVPIRYTQKHDTLEAWIKSRNFARFGLQACRSPCAHSREIATWQRQPLGGMKGNRSLA